MWWVALLVAGCRFGFDPNATTDAVTTDAVTTDAVISNDAMPSDGDTGDGPSAGCQGHVTIPNGPAGSSYRFDPAEKTWLEAEALCESFGSHLLVLANSSERDAVIAASGINVWIGISDRVVDGTFRDVTGSATQFFEWRSNEPSLAAADDCVAMDGGGGNVGKFRAVECDATFGGFGFACECDGNAVDPSAF